MEIEQKITLTEKQLKEILTKALKLSPNDKIAFNFYKGGQTEIDYVEAHVTTKTTITIN